MLLSAPESPMVAASSAVTVPTFVILGPPRTKKTSNRIIRFGKNREHVKIMPSEQYVAWHKLAMEQAPAIRSQLIRAGVSLPICEPVSVRALFYREKRIGDLTGYVQALADWMQMSLQRNGKTVRTGAGIIRDDSQIEGWDGSRRLHDKFQPRIEVHIEIVAGGQIAMALEEEF